jgi:hypothetical protein
MVMADLSKVMERERLCSLHAAQCWIDAKRQDNKRSAMTARKTEHCIDWRKPAAEIDAEFTAMSIEVERLRGDRDALLVMESQALTDGRTMTDRELIEAAAQAAGLDLGRWDEDHEVWVYPFHSDVTDGHRWNPLTDDGDALRLAVKLNLLFMPYPFDKAVRVVDSATAENTVVSWGTPPDPCAATRRAIVQAAARVEALRGERMR